MLCKSYHFQIGNVHKILVNLQRKKFVSWWSCVLWTIQLTVFVDRSKLYFTNVTSLLFKHVWSKISYTALTVEFQVAWKTSLGIVDSCKIDVKWKRGALKCIKDFCGLQDFCRLYESYMYLSPDSSSLSKGSATLDYLIMFWQNNHILYSTLRFVPEV